MSTRNIVNDAVRIAILGAAIPLTIGSGVANAQEDLAEVVVTGTRISAPGVTSSSPILSVSAAEIDQLQQPEVEKIFRQLPITLPSDGQNVNNGTGGAATISLRGLGSQRNLIMLDGKRMTPYSISGAVDTQTIPTAMIERIDIITGGASAVYGSDAISGAINFITKRDFSGIAINTDFSQTGESDGKIKSTDILLGANMADGRGNIVLGLNYSNRDGVQLGARYDSVYTKPDITENYATLMNLAVNHSVSDNLSLSGNAYYRRIHANTFNGDINEASLDQAVYQPNAAERAALTAADRKSTRLNSSHRT